MLRCVASSLLLLLLCLPLVAGESEEAFWEAAREGDLETVKRLHGEGVDVNARTKYGATGAGDETFRSGLYGDVDSVDDESEHLFKFYALDRNSGEIVWEKTAARAVPGAKRHLKSTQANSTPAGSTTRATSGATPARRSCTTTS